MSQIVQQLKLTKDHPMMNAKAVTTTMMHRTLRALSLDDLHRIARAIGLEPDNMQRTDVEYELAGAPNQEGLARLVGLIVWRALRRELKKPPGEPGG